LVRLVRDCALRHGPGSSRKYDPCACHRPAPVALAHEGRVDQRCGRGTYRSAARHTAPAETCAGPNQSVLVESWPASVDTAAV